MKTKPGLFSLVLLGLLLCLIEPVSGQQEIANAPAGNYPLRATLSPWPAVPGKAHLVVDVDKPTTGESALPSLTLAAVLDMPATPTMRPLLSTIPKKRTGHFEGDVLFTMSGKWRIQLLLATPNGEFRVISLVQVGKGKGLPALTNPAGDDSCGTGPLTDETLKLTCFPNPPQVGDNRLFIQLPKDGTYKKVMVGVDMAGMPMSILPQEATSKGAGRYEVDLNLPMSGVWQVRVDLDGQVPPPKLLNVNAAGKRPLSRPLLWLTLAAAVPLGVGFALRKKPLAPLVTALTLAVSTFSAGAVIERYWPAEESMDMSAPMPSMSAPTPVLEAVVQRVPLAVYRKYPARVEPLQEMAVTGSGPVWELLDTGLPCKTGQVLGRVGGQLLKAPVNGVVLRRYAEIGQTVAPGSPVLTVAAIDQVRVRGRVPVSEHIPVLRGAPVDVEDGETLTRAIITNVSATSEGDHYWVETTIKNRQKPVASMSHSGTALPLPKAGDDGGRPGRLPLGQNVWLRCRVEQLEPVLCVPKEAVFERSGSQYVMVVSSIAGQSLAYQRRVTTGLSNDTHTEVVTGLREGETVVALAQEPLAEGTPVTPASWGTGSYRDLMIPNNSPHSL